MSVYFALIKRAFQRQMRYRASIIAGLGTNFFWGMLRVMIFVALFDDRGTVGGISLQNAITFTAISQASIAFLSMFGWYEMMNTVYTGDIASDLLKPISFYPFWMAKDFGRSLSNFLTRGITIIIAYSLFVKLTFPKSLQQYLGVTIVLLLAWFLSFSIRFLYNLFSFWIPNAKGIGRMFFIISLFFSGFLMPLKFFPEWVSKIAYFTPFPYLVNLIFESFVGLITGPELISAILIQIIWIIILALMVRIALKAGIRRLVILGG